MMIFLLLVCCSSVVFAARCPTEDCYESLQTRDDAKNCHTFWGCRLAQEQGCPLESARLNWVNGKYKLPQRQK